MYSLIVLFYTVGVYDNCVSEELVPHVGVGQRQLSLHCRA